MRIPVHLCEQGFEVLRTLGAPEVSPDTPQTDADHSTDYQSQRLWISEYNWATSMNDVLDHVFFVVL